MIEPTPKEVFFELIEFERKVLTNRIESHSAAIRNQLSHDKSGLINVYVIEKSKIELNLLTQISLINQNNSNLSDIEIIGMILKHINLCSVEIQQKMSNNNCFNSCEKEALINVIAVLSSYAWAWGAVIGKL